MTAGPSQPTPPLPISLRAVTEDDLPVFFQHQCDPEAVRVAAFTHEDPEDHDAFRAHWARVLANPAIVPRTILVAGACVGHLAAFERDGTAEVTFWIDRAWWGRGVATRALALFLHEFPRRPLQARTASDNGGSLRVLERNGFRVIGTDRYHAHGRGCEIPETILELGAN